MFIQPTISFILRNNDVGPVHKFRIELRLKFAPFGSRRNIRTSVRPEVEIGDRVPLTGWYPDTPDTLPHTCYALYNTVKFLPSNICHVDNFCRKILKNLQNRQSPKMFKKFCDGKMCFPHLPWHPEPTLEFWWQRFWAKISSMPPGWTGWNNTFCIKMGTFHQNWQWCPRVGDLCSIPFDASRRSLHSLKGSFSPPRKNSDARVGNPKKSPKSPVPKNVQKILWRENVFSPPPMTPWTYPGFLVATFLGEKFPLCHLAGLRLE